MLVATNARVVAAIVIFFTILSSMDWNEDSPAESPRRHQRGFSLTRQPHC
jgi:hypothetical protein